ncbi:MAG TPA: fibronectin type III domain-containing protein [Candidatus Angelobacter sp.]|nr:fibronectin type III domain-containing protein [Candidatus Angelobacter sp.]
MKKLFAITGILLLCACFAVAQTPATPQTSTQPTSTDIVKPMLEFANANSAKIAWTTRQGADLDLHYSTDRNNLQQAAVGAVEHMNGDNHRATLTGLQPNTTYFVAMTNKQGQPIGPVFSFKTPAQGQAAIHEQPLIQVQ